MTESLTSSDQLTIVAFLIPIIVLIVSTAIDSVEKQDPVQHRKWVGALGAMSILSASVVIVTIILEEIFGITSQRLGWYILGTVISTLVLVMRVQLKELFRGLEPGSERYAELDDFIDRATKYVLVFYAIVYIIDISF